MKFHLQLPLTLKYTFVQSNANCSKHRFGKEIKNQHLRKEMHTWNGQQSGADPGFDQGGPQIVTGLKLPFWGLSFVEFWCWGLIFGGRGGQAPGAPPGSAPEQCFGVDIVIKIVLIAFTDFVTFDLSSNIYL